MWSLLIAVTSIWWCFGPIFFTILSLMLSPWYALLFLTIPVAWWLDAWAWEKWSYWI